MHIGGVAFQAAAAAVRAACQECGTLVYFNSLVPGKSIAFPTFGRREEAERAKAKLDGTSYEGLTLQIKWAKGKVPFLTFDNNTGEGTVEETSGYKRPEQYAMDNRSNQQKRSKWDM